MHNKDANSIFVYSAILGHQIHSMKLAKDKYRPVWIITTSTNIPITQKKVYKKK